MISSRKGLAVVAAFVCVFFLIAANPFSTGAPAGWTGAPGDSGDCTFCHQDAPANSGSGSVVINAPATYQPGVEYGFSVVVSDPVAIRFGFEITAKDASATLTGEWVIVNGSETKFAGIKPEYVTHSDAPFSTVSQEFFVRWKAPDTDVGDITFYAAGNGATNTGSSSGDQIYTSSKVATPSGPTSVEHEKPHVGFLITEVFPVPFVDHTTFMFELAEPGLVTISVFDLAGSQVYNSSFGSFSPGTHSVRLDAADMPAVAAGVLLYRLTAGAESQTGRIILIR